MKNKTFAEVKFWWMEKKNQNISPLKFFERKTFADDQLSGPRFHPDATAENLVSGPSAD